MKLVPMTEKDFRQYLDRAIVSYAQDQVDAGAWQPALAEGLARQVMNNLLPEGLETPENRLFMLVNEEGAQTGYLWLGMRDEGGSRVAVLYDFEIYEPYRRRGYGRAALGLLEDEARQDGAERVLLHVFGHNAAARSLYQKASFTERNVTMVKELGN